MSNIQKYTLKKRLYNIGVALVFPFAVFLHCVKTERSRFGVLATLLCVVGWPFILVAALLGRKALQVAVDIGDVVYGVIYKRWNK